MELARLQSCGCVVCTCDDDERCHGCGAKNCGKHPVGQFTNPQYTTAPILTPAQVQEIEQAFDSKLVRTHYAECWQYHWECAIARLIEHIRALEMDLETVKHGRDLAWASRDEAETERIEAVQRYEAAEKRNEALNAARIKYGPICLLCGKSTPCMTEAEANSHGGSIPCTFDPAPRELWQRCKTLEAENTRLQEALAGIRDMRQDELKDAMDEGDTLHILGCMAKLFNQCRDLAKHVLARTKETA